MNKNVLCRTCVIRNNIYEFDVILTLPIYLDLEHKFIRFHKTTKNSYRHIILYTIFELKFEVTALHFATVIKCMSFHIIYVGTLVCYSDYTNRYIFFFLLKDQMKSALDPVKRWIQTNTQLKNHNYNFT